MLLSCFVHIFHTNLSKSRQLMHNVSSVQGPAVSVWLVGITTNQTETLKLMKVKDIKSRRFDFDDK